MLDSATHRSERFRAHNVSGVQPHSHFAHDVHRLAGLAVDGRRNDVGQSSAVALFLRDAAFVERVVEAVDEVALVHDADSTQPRPGA